MMSLRFVVHLSNYKVDSDPPNGPLFHRWLPDGIGDAVRISTSDSRNQIEIWFERRGFIQDAFIRYDAKRREVDVAVMKRQARLDGGPLFGRAEYVHTTDAEIDAVRTNVVGSADYIALGKRVLEFLVPPLSAFIDTLRMQYGQYWVRPLEPWDSRQTSLGSYCRGLSLEWRHSPDEEWRDFTPTENVQHIDVTAHSGRVFGQYLTEADWRSIQATFDPRRDQSLALRVITRAHELRDTGQPSEAFIHAVTAVELAVEQFLAKRTHDNVAKSMGDQFSNLPLPVKVWTLATVGDFLSEDTILAAVQAIELRNEIVHEGRWPDDPPTRLFDALVECVRGFIGVLVLKMPPLNTGNALSDPPSGS